MNAHDPKFDEGTPWTSTSRAKYVLVTQDLTDEQKEAVVEVLHAALKEVGWTFHKVIEEDFLVDYNAHKLIVTGAKTGNPPGGSNG